jgi:serine/threonine protein kinase
VEGPNALGSRYELEQKLGVGAMGEVWRALDRRSGQRVAAKVLRAEFARDTDIVTRFIQERSILMGLTHPNIVRVRDLVVEGERLAIVMDLIEGGDLRHHLREHGPIAADHAVPLACVVLDALDSAHQSGCLHRDVKPDNVLLVDGDVARPQNLRLSDFSIARLAHDSTVQSTGLLGTPNYMPPELFRVGQFSAASDVYATGILLYEMLGGRTPFAGSGTAHTMGNRHVSSLPPRLPVSEPLWAAIEQMLAKDPRDRLRAAATASLLRGLPSDALGADVLPLQPVPEVWEDVAQTVVRRPASAGPSGLGSEATEARRAPAPVPARRPPGAGPIGAVRAHPPSIRRDRPHAGGLLRRPDRAGSRGRPLPLPSSCSGSVASRGPPRAAETPRVRSPQQSRHPQEAVRQRPPSGPTPPCRSD